MFQSEKWLEPKVLPWKHQNVHNYVSFIKFNTHVSYSKFQSLDTNTSGDILYLICDLICLRVVSLHSTIRHLKCPNSHNYTKTGISLEWKTYNQKVNAIIPRFERIFINKLDLFFNLHILEGTWCWLQLTSFVPCQLYFYFQFLHLEY